MSFWRFGKRRRACREEMFHIEQQFQWCCHKLHVGDRRKEPHLKSWMMNLHKHSSVFCVLCSVFRDYSILKPSQMRKHFSWTTVSAMFLNEEICMKTISEEGFQPKCSVPKFLLLDFMVINFQSETKETMTSHKNKFKLYWPIEIPPTSGHILQNQMLTWNTK